ncbi:DUF2207 domain-containing protein [Cellulomonas fimi]|uniref:DUF2207 domain-containing protein n=1 Tax=Cellulomonas fimi TaxID=1708 RepID=A0A7Y0QIA5_CELFI|nr:DUF2207 domain-containing protein [Cellulomonas fimi]NMR20988.1 DUF2207 domain-containing protein [Cellulomonas fimi]
MTSPAASPAAPALHPLALGGRRLVLATVAVVALVAALLLALALPAGAATSGNEITRYDVEVDLARDGTMDVVLDLDFDFGDDPGRGPYLTFPTSMRFDDDSDRVFAYSNVTARSDDPAAAPDDVNLEEESGWLQVRIGDEDVDDVEGVHRYRITYTVRGLVNGTSTTGGDDELFWNVLSDTAIPVGDLSVTVRGPADLTGIECVTGPRGARNPCDDARADGSTATYALGALPEGQALTVLAQFPAGTFRDVEPVLRERWQLGKAFSLTPWTGVATAAVLLVGLGVALGRVRQRGRDARYLHQVPGTTPEPGSGGVASVGLGSSSREMPIAVHLAPPAGFRPGQLGTLVDERADPHDVTATLVDLAVRGYLRIEEIEPGRSGAAEGEDGSERESEDGEVDEDTTADATGLASSWRLIRERAPDDALVPYERALLEAVFTDRSRVSLTQLRATFASSMSAVQRLLYEDVTARGWFRGNPSAVRRNWYVTGTVLTLVGLLLTFFLAVLTRWGLVGLAVLVVGVVVLAVAHAAPARTAEGTAVLSQTLGFKQYLATADPDRLRIAAGEDLFSQYLPYAIAFGITEQWAGVFQEAAARGASVPAPTWYAGASGYNPALFWAAGGFGQSVDQFSEAATQSISAPTPGTTGSSGSGSFSGGGVGGGSVGGW